jgi:ATP phosphoribosyltransferase
MVELQKILDITSHLIVNRSSFKTANEEINQIIKAFDVSK